jgi:Leucine-rich repeat (LRR) protein
VQAGVEKLSGLEVLYMSNNKVRDWAEIDKLATLENLKVQYAAVMTACNRTKSFQPLRL